MKSYSQVAAFHRFPGKESQGLGSDLYLLGSVCIMMPLYTAGLDGSDVIVASSSIVSREWEYGGYTKDTQANQIHQFLDRYL